MSSAAGHRERIAIEMRVQARHIFERALTQSGIDLAFERHVSCERGVVRICEDLYDLHSFNRVLVVSIGKAAHTMVSALETQAGNNFEGIVASSVQPGSQARGFRYFHGGHPTPNEESIRAAEAILKSAGAQNTSSLVIFMLSGGGSSIAEKPIDDDISLEELVTTYKELVHSGAPIAEIRRSHEQAVNEWAVFGVPTFVMDGRAVFVRLMSRPRGDAALARRTIDNVVQLLEDHPDLNEFKYTTLSQ